MGRRGQQTTLPRFEHSQPPTSPLSSYLHRHPAFQVPGLTPLRIQVPVLFEQLWFWGQPWAWLGLPGPLWGYLPTLGRFFLQPVASFTSQGTRHPQFRTWKNPPLPSKRKKLRPQVVISLVSSPMWEMLLPLDLPQGGWRSSDTRRNPPPPTTQPFPAPWPSQQEREAVTRPGGDDAAGRAGHSWPLPERSPTPLAWVTAPAKLPDTETPRGLRVSGTILRLMGSDSSAPPPSTRFPLAAPPLLLLTRPLQAQSGWGAPAGAPAPSTQPN